MTRTVLICATCLALAIILQTPAQPSKPADALAPAAPNEPAKLFDGYEEIILAKRNRGAMVPGSIVIAPGRDKWGAAMQQFLWERSYCTVSRESATYIADLFVEFLLNERPLTWNHAPTTPDDVEQTGQNVIIRTEADPQ